MIRTQRPKQTIRDYIGNVFAALVMLAFAIVVGFVGYLYLLGKGIDVTEPLEIPEAIIKLSTDCNGLRGTIDAGERCEASDNCQMTGTEFKAFSDAKSDYAIYCRK